MVCLYGDLLKGLLLRYWRVFFQEGKEERLVFDLHNFSCSPGFIVIGLIFLFIIIPYYLGVKALIRDMLRPVMEMIKDFHILRIDRV